MSVLEQRHGALEGEREGSVVFDGGRARVSIGRRLGMASFALLVALFVYALLAVSAWAQDLRIEKRDSEDPVEVGELLTYTIKVTNLGPLAVTTPIEVTDRLPADVRAIGYTISDPGFCTFDGRNVECTLEDGLAAPASDDSDEATIRITVQPEEDAEGEEITNEATVTDTQASDTNDEVTIETDVEANENPNNNPNNNRRQYRPPRLFPPGFLQEQYEEAEEAENELSSLENEEGTTDTFSDEGDIDEGTTGDDGGAFAQSGDPDEFAPEDSVRGNVVDEVPTEGPLPNTGGPLAIFLPLGMVLFGVGLLLVRLAAIWRGRT
jgi:uncharacterized repeat protein (TIGR01451 family)